MGDTYAGAGGVSGLPAPACPQARPAPQHGSHLPVDVLLDEAGALSDVKTLQQSCGRGRGRVTSPIPGALTS